MLMDEIRLKNALSDIVLRIIQDNISVEEVRKWVQNELEPNYIWKSESLLITDCYYALKHIQEENITTVEWEYFAECFSDLRQYSMEEKIKYINIKH